MNRTDERKKALELCKEITGYWRRRGRDAKIQVVELCLGPKDRWIVSDSGRTSMYILRSNMTNGLPPKCEK